MPLTLNSQPDAIVSVAENIEYEYTVTPANVYFICYGSTPFGLAKFGLADLAAIAPPSLAVGNIVHVTDAASIYYGTHVVTEIILAAGVSVTFVVNTVFTATESPTYVANAEIFTDLNYTINKVGLGPVNVANIANPSFVILANNIVKLKVSEYVRSYFSGANLHSVAIGVSKSGMAAVVTSTVVNTILTSAQIKSLFRTGGSGSIAPKILDLSSVQIYFQGFKTWITESNFTSGPDELFNTVNTIYTQTGTAPTNILGTQTTELLNGCFKDALNIVYLNFAGGLRNYVVYNDIAISREFGNETRFKNDQLAEYIQSVQHFENYEVSCENIRCTHSETIDQIIASPLTWLADSDGNLTPIVINKDSFLKYQSWDESLNFSFSFRKSATNQSQIN
jgi:hypothetical protein